MVGILLEFDRLLQRLRSGHGVVHLVREFKELLSERGHVERGLLSHRRDLMVRFISYFADPLYPRFHALGDDALGYEVVDALCKVGGTILPVLRWKTMGDSDVHKQLAAQHYSGGVRTHTQTLSDLAPDLGFILWQAQRHPQRLDCR